MACSKLKATDLEAKPKTNRGQLWSEDATNGLIELWSEETIQFSLDNCKTSKESSAVYRSLQVQLKEKGFVDFTPKEVINKMKKLRQKYKLEKDKRRKSGNSSTKKEWKFFKQMDRILAQKHNVNPPCIMDTMLVNDGQDIAELNQGLNCVDDLTQKYGQGEVTTRKCDTCDYEMTIHSSGVHEIEGGSVKVYCADDDFFCPNCNVGKLDDDDNIEEVVGADGSDKKAEEPECQKKYSITPKRKRKTNVEKSLAAVFEKFKQSSSDEFMRFQQYEEGRLKKDREFREQQRVAERQHELNVIQLLLGAQNTAVNTMPATVNTLPATNTMHAVYQPMGHTYPVVHECADGNTYFDLS